MAELTSKGQQKRILFMLRVINHSWAGRVTEGKVPARGSWPALPGQCRAAEKVTDSELTVDSTPPAQQPGGRSRRS